MAGFVLAALAWPSLGPLPWAVMDLAPAQYAVAPEGDAHFAPHEHHGDASDIPGSPTHPADHDCFQCQVLKHLARCVPYQTNASSVPLPSGDAIQPCARIEPQRTGFVAFLPPVRAPPPRGA
ncbi:MAG TPA: hypothetical protein VFF44_14530 [Casimicrobiaceae bacterium]|nr:hypothetical protein [Casimicrobiaceae bacterium]